MANDLFIDGTSEGGFNYERLEFQANAFASNLLLPDQFFRLKVADRRRALEIRDRGHGYIFVDDQPCNYWPYTQLLSGLSSDFEASKTAVEIKLTNMGLLTDQRRVGKSPFAQVLSGLTSMPR